MSNTRKVTIWSTKGKKKAVIETDVQTWEGLKPLISDEGYNLDKLRATENVNKATLEHKDAVLPTGDFTVFLRPVKTKSGGKDYDSMKFKELRAELTDEDKEALKAELGGRNWTQAKTTELKDYLKKRGDSAPAATEEVEEAKAEAVEETTSDAPETPEAKVEKAKSLLLEVKDASEDDEVKERIDLAVEEIDGVLSIVSESFAAAEKARQEEEEAKKADEEETERLKSEADDFMDGF